ILIGHAREAELGVDRLLRAHEPAGVVEAEQLQQLAQTLLGGWRLQVFHDRRRDARGLEAGERLSRLAAARIVEDLEAGHPVTPSPSLASRRSGAAAAVNDTGMPCTCRCSKRRPTCRTYPARRRRRTRRRYTSRCSTRSRSCSRCPRCGTTRTSRRVGSVP